MTEIPPLALLAGGLATRLRPLTHQIPKAMIEIAGEPFIAHQLRLLSRERISHVVLCVGHLADQIKDYVGDGTRFGLFVDYNVDGPKLLGTGGALRASLNKLGSEFFVMYGDSWLDTSIAPIVEAFRESGKPALMTVFRNEGKWDTSNVWFESGTIKRYDKGEQMPEMHYIDWGLGLLKAEVLAAQPESTPFDLAEIYRDLALTDSLAGYEVTNRFYEIGSPEGLRETDKLLSSAGYGSVAPRKPHP